MDLNALADFLAVADSGGISAAARLRNVPKQTLSRRLQRLELDLGVRLFDRSTRVLRLTDEGRLLRDRVARALSGLDDAQRELADRAEAPRGRIRVSAPLLMGHTLLGRIVGEYALRYPDVEVELVLSDRRIQLVEDGYDLAIRVGELADSALLARRLGQGETILVAAPALLARHGPPTRPAALRDYPCLGFGDRRDTVVWTLRHADQIERVPIQPRITANSLILCRDAAIAGAGVAAIPAFVVRDALADGTLQRVLPDWVAGVDPISVVYPSRRQLPPRTRAFIDTLIAAFEQIAL